MIERTMNAITHAVGHPLAVPAFLVFVAVSYAATGLNGANLVISILTLALLPILQHAQNHDTAAVQAKLDALIKSIDEVPNSFVGLDEATEDEIEARRRALNYGSDAGRAGSADAPHAGRPDDYDQPDGDRQHRETKGWRGDHR